MSKLTSQTDSAQPILRTSPRTSASNTYSSSNGHNASTDQAPTGAKQQGANPFRPLRVAGTDPAPAPSKEALPKPEFELFTISDILKMPRPRWLIREMLVEKTASLLSADSGSYKSLLALDMALCIALGRPFMGREVQQGTAVYVAAEGSYTLRDRLTAWSLFHNCTLPENFHILRVPVDVANPAKRRRFVETIINLSPVLIVLDTLSQCSVGRKENSNDEMAEFMRGMMDACEELGAHVQALHHNGKGGGVVRGAEAIKANADTVITLDKAGGEEKYKVFVRSEKQRGADFEDFALQGNVVTLPYCDEFGKIITSLVFEPCSDVVAPKSTKRAKPKRSEITREKLLTVFDALATEYDGVKIGTWRAAVLKGDPPVCSPSTFWDHRVKLEEEGIIWTPDSHQGSPLFYRKGATPSTPGTPNRSNQSNRSDQDSDSDSEYSNNSKNSLEFGVIGVESDGGTKSTHSKAHKPQKGGKAQ